MPRIRNDRTRITTAGYLTSRALARNLRSLASAHLIPYLVSASGSGPLLDVGCGNGPYARLIPDKRIVGVNIDRVDALPKVVADGMRLPFRSGLFAAAICTQVIEHVRDPDRLLDEIGRCIRPGGMLLLSCPMYWPLHEEPHDYWRFTPYGLRLLLEKHGFEPIELRQDGHAISMAVVAVNQLFRGVLFLPLRAALNALGLVAERFVRIRHSTTNLSVLARNAR